METLIGTEAIANAVVTRAELQRWYRPIFRNVHATRDQPLTLGDRTRGAWLWSAREGIVTGLAAAAIHGSQWIEDDIDIELIHHYPRPPSGIITRHERIADDEWAEFDGIPVTTPARTAFDLGRHQPGALSRLDALMRARPYSIEDVLILTKRYKGARGVARLKQIVGLVDAGAESPWESWWRQLVIDAGFPAPTTQIPVLDESGRHVRTLDFGWNDHKVAFEYDGEQHQSDRQQYLKDRRVWPVLARLGWQVTSTVKEDDPVDVLAQLHSSMAARGWRGTIQIPDYVYRRRRRP